MKICLVPLTSNVSGTERVVQDIIKKLASETPHQTFLLTPTGERLDAFARALEKYVDSSHAVKPFDKKHNILSNLREAFLFFRRTQPDCIHFHCPHYKWGLETIFAARAARVRHILRTEHNPMMSPPPRAIGALLRISDRFVTRFTYVSSGNQHRYEAHLPVRIGRGMTICNGVDADRYRFSASTAERIRLRREFAFPDDAFVAVFVGSIEERRPLTPIFEAFHALLANPNSQAVARTWRILIVGSEKGQPTSIDSAKRLGIENYVRFAGRRDDVAQLLPQCDLFVSASHFEGLSIAMLEAWACGVPLLTTHVDGVADVLGDEVAKKVMTPHKDTEAFARMWLRFMQDSVESRRVQEAAMETVRTQFTVERMLSQYLSLYRTVLGE